MAVRMWEYGHTVVAHGATWDFHPGKTRDDFADAYAKNELHAERDFGANPPQSVQSALHDKALVERICNMDRVSPIDEHGGFHEWFQGDPRFEYFMHIDMSMASDNTGMGMCHYDLEKDTFVVDLCHTIEKTRDWKLSFERIFHLILTIKELGFKFSKVTFDSWQSFSTIERLSNKGIPAGLYSVDRGTEAYDTLIETMLLQKIDFYWQAKFIEEMKELKLYKGNKYDHPPGGSKDTSDGVAGCIAQCVLARVGLNLTTVEVEQAVHDEHVFTYIEHRTADGGTYYVMDDEGLVMEAHERNRKRVMRIDATRDYLITVLGWNDKLHQRLYVDEYLVWQDYSNQQSLEYFQEFINKLLKIGIVDSFSLNANVPIEIVNFLRGTGRRVSSPLSTSAATRGQTRVARTGVITPSLIRSMVSQLKQGNLTIPRNSPLIKDLKYMTDDNQRERTFVAALAGWTDFISREVTYGRTGQSMPRPTASIAAPLNSATAGQTSKAAPRKGGSPDVDRIRAKYNVGMGRVPAPTKTQEATGQKRLPRSRKMRRR